MNRKSPLLLGTPVDYQDQFLPKFAPFPPFPPIIDVIDFNYLHLFVIKSIARSPPQGEGASAIVPGEGDSSAMKESGIDDSVSNKYPAFLEVPTALEMRKVGPEDVQPHV